VGLATAYSLAELGARVQLIEAATLAAGASGANAGGIWPNDQGPLHPPGFQPLAFEGRDLWGRLSLRPEFEIDWRVNGFLNLNFERIAPTAEEAARRLQEQGYAVQPVDSEQIAALEPQLREGLHGGLHFPSEAHLHPVKAILSLARGARRRGAAISCGVAAVAVRRNGGRITHVETTGGIIEPRQIVATTGWTAGWLTDGTAWLPPLRPVSGQLISTRPLPPLLKGTVAGRFLVFQLRTGEIVTGGNVLESDRLAVDMELAAQFAGAAREMIPALQNVEFSRAWCGLRPGTPDGLPIIDRVPGVTNAWMACGHFRNGVLLAPATGRNLAEWIVRDACPEVLQPFRHDRFPAA
jgi:glycine oxidase